MQAVLFEIQLLKSVDGVLAMDGDELDTKLSAYEEIEVSGGPEFSRDEAGGEEKKKVDRKGSQGLRSILLKGEMRYLKDANMLIFLCSPL